MYAYMRDGGCAICIHILYAHGIIMLNNNGTSKGVCESGSQSFSQGTYRYTVH